MNQLTSIDESFSKKAVVYDDYGRINPIIKYSRYKVRSHVLRYLQKSNKILELNGGTGEDALFFGSKGFRIHVIDIASGMISKIKLKIEENRLQSLITYQKLSFHNIYKLKEGPFDYVFSNFGGLNCTHDLTSVINNISNVLNYGGYVTIVFMPSICPWELMNIFWNPKTALRRLPSIFGLGIKSNVSGTSIKTYYYSLNSVLKMFGNSYDLIDIESLSLFCPPSYMDRFPYKHPKLFQNLIKLENRFLKYTPFYKFGDFIILTMKLK